MIWNVVVGAPARKSLKRFPLHDAEAIQRALHEMEQDPFTGDVRKLGPRSYRRRVRDYRIFFDLWIEQQIVEVTAIRRRTTTTYR
jgi:mRNA-degrading endonuclease RelE of RelBE toxin-antitoxin system